MASIRPRGNKYQARVRIKGENLSGNFTNKRDAQAWVREMEADIERGKAVGSTDTLSDVIDR